LSSRLDASELQSSDAAERVFPRLFLPILPVPEMAFAYVGPDTGVSVIGALLARRSAVGPRVISY
jgi:hypothetical protein